MDLLSRLPKDIISSELFIRLDLIALVNLSKTNQYLRSKSIEEINKRLVAGILREDNYTLAELRNLGLECPMLIDNIIYEIDRRLNFNYLKEIMNTFLNGDELSDWDWDTLVKNQNISMDDIEQNIHRILNTESISYFPNLTIADIIKHPEYNWNWQNKPSSFQDPGDPPS